VSTIPTQASSEKTEMNSRKQVPFMDVSLSVEINIEVQSGKTNCGG